MGKHKNQKMIFDFGDALQLREATRADYDDVFNINKNVYEGNDYLPEVYAKWLDDDARDNFVIASGNDVVGFFSLSKYPFGDSDVFVEQALRLSSSVHGKNISKKIIKWIGGYTKSKSARPILLSVSMLYERDFSRAMSAENQNRI